MNLDLLVVKGTPFDLIIGLVTLKGLQACIDLGKQHGQVRVGENIAKLGHIMEVEQVAQSRNSTGSEYFTSDSEAVPDSSTTSENDLFLVTIDRPSSEPNLRLIKMPESATDGAREGLDGLPYLLEEDPGKQHVALLTETLRHLASKARESMISSRENS